MTDFYKEKMLIDVLGRPIPQYYDEEKGVFIAKTNGTGDASNVDFRKKKMLIDVQSFPIPQYYDVVEGKFKPITSEGSSGGGVPANHTHKIADVEGLYERLTEVFTQVSNGKSSLETVIIEKGSNVEKVGDVATFEELKEGILKIENKNDIEKFFSDEYPLPITSSYFQSRDGYIIVRHPTEIMMYAINGHMEYDTASGSYKSTKTGYGRWLLTANEWVYIAASSLRLTGADIILENILELSHNLILDDKVVLKGKIGSYNWYENIY